MSSFSDLQTLFPQAAVLRGNELHLEIRQDEILNLAALLHNEYSAALILILANDRRADLGRFDVHYLFANHSQNWFVHATLPVPAEDPQITSLATFFLPAGRYEREMADLFGIKSVGHPLTRRLVRHSFWPETYYPLLKDSAPPRNFHGEAAPYPFLPVEGEGIYEIPVGPVHAGIIEPGHFRFSVVGETVINLQMHLFFTHKGVEKLFEGRTPAEGVELAERISGDTTIGHSLAYCQALESLAGCQIPPRAAYLRVILLEMERLYNHIADFGAICNDTGFAFAHSHCFRIRERLLRLNKQLTGNRLLRGGIVPGGVGNDLPAGLDLAAEVGSVLADINEVVAISLANTMLMDRLVDTGRLTTRTAQDHGVLGPVARASGIAEDVRRDHPFAAYARLKFKIPCLHSGDVHARTLVRVEEVRESAALIQQALADIPQGPIQTPLGPLPAYTPAFGLVEAWRGALVHWVMAGADGLLYRVKVKDPSFVNWPALPFALLKNIVPDFPLCNKSFNQSYSGNDL